MSTIGVKVFFFSSRRRHTRFDCDWSSDVCSSDLLLVQMRADVVDPDLIVDIKRIPETRTVAEEKGGWRIGAAVTGAELKEHVRLKQAWPGVVEAANLIGSTQVQGRATLGGNLCNGS